MPVPASRSDPRRVLSLVWAERGAYLPGLFFVGVHFLRKRKSSILYGVGEDAAIVASGVAARARS